MRFKKRERKHDKNKAEKCFCIITRLPFLPNRYRRQYYENIAETAAAVAACRFSFEQVTRREITSSIISGCDWQRSPAVRPRGNWRDKIINLYVYLV